MSKKTSELVATTAKQAVKIIAPGRTASDFRGRTVRGSGRFLERFGAPYVLDGSVWKIGGVEAVDRKHLTMLFGPPGGQAEPPTEVLPPDHPDIRQLQRDIAETAARMSQMEDRRVFLVPTDARTDFERSAFTVGQYGTEWVAPGRIFLSFRVHPGPEEEWKHMIARRKRNEDKPVQSYTLGEHDVEVWRDEESAPFVYEVQIAGYTTGGEFEPIFKVKTKPSKREVQREVDRLVREHEERREENPRVVATTDLVSKLRF